MPVEQNGSGVSATRVERFDRRGNLVWLKDERGTITYHEYDAAGRNLVQTIQDVDGSRLDLPSNWTTPSGGGLHLVTDYTFDSLGRQREVLGPPHEVDVDGTAATVRTASWTVYNDADHETWSAQGYYVPATNTYTLVNPVSITKRNAAGTRSESIQAVRTSTSGKLTAADTFDQSSYVRWSVSLSNAAGQLTATRVYHTIPASGDGSSGTNYDETTFAYDSLGRQNRQETPGGTITRTVYNVLDQAIAIYVGTDDTCATDDDPTGNGTLGNNMVPVSESEYAGPSGCTGCCGGGGAGQLVRTLQHVDDTTTRTTEYMYDWRNRQEFVLSDADDQGRYVYSRNQYDNLDQVIRVERYHDVAGDGPDPDGGTHPDDILISRSDTFTDDRGRTYRTRNYAVDPETGEVGNYLEGNTWYDAAGNAIKQQSAGTQQFSKTVYDGLGRSVKQYVGFDVHETSYADAMSVTDDTILEQTETAYDAAGSTIFVTHRRRFHNATGEGELTTPSGSRPKARVSYVAYYQDALGRQIATANYGTNDGVTPTRSATVPARSDEILVTSTEYDNTGMAYKSIDPMGREDRQFFDALGRVTKTVQNYKDGIVVESAPDEDVTVEMTYNADGQLATLTAWNLTTGNQVTRYVYGTTLTNSAIARSDLLRAEIYPDSDDTAGPLGSGVSGLYDRVEYGYNRQGQRIAKKDQNETVHTYRYDRLGRLIEDEASQLGPDIDETVCRISTTYEVRGMVQRIASYGTLSGEGGSSSSSSSAGEVVINEVLFVYSDFGQLTAEYQEHDGEVNVLTTPRVQNDYSDGSAGHARLTKMTYPNGRCLLYGYGTTGAMDDIMSRLASIGDGTNTFAVYKYLGADKIVEEDYVASQTKLSYLDSSGNVAGLDPVDRIVDQVWTDYGANPNTVLEQYTYTYDRAGNRTSKTNTLNGDLSESYEYDGMDRLIAWDLGGVKQKTWSFDPLGNDLASGTYNAANEETPTQGSSGYDDAGNMTTLPSGRTAAYDAWNRLVEVTNGETAIERYEYDATGRRIRVRSDFAGSTPGKVVDDYHKGQQTIESDVTVNGTRAGGNQYIWSPRYIDAAVLRDTLNTAGTAIVAAERVFYLSDANYNVTGLVKYDSGDQRWEPAERYTYTPYGIVTYRNADWTTANSSTNANTSLYTGRTLDLLTTLYYYRARYYDATLQRFVSRDPIGYRAGSGLYEYVGNGPVGKTDPSGLLDSEYWHTAWSCMCACNWAKAAKLDYQTIFNDVATIIWRMTFTDAEMSKLPLREGEASYLIPGQERPAHLDQNTADPVVKALQHCIGGGIVAAKSSCECSACVTNARADWYLYHATGQKWSPAYANTALYNYWQGRSCARCKGKKADETPGKWYTEPGETQPIGVFVSDPFPTEKQIVSCCRNALIAGQLWLGPPLGKPPDPTWNPIPNPQK